jgi:hypothetical protein
MKIFFEKMKKLNIPIVIKKEHELFYAVLNKCSEADIVNMRRLEKAKRKIANDPAES